MHIMMRDDQACDPPLLARLSQGDEAAFRELYSAYRARLYSFLLRLSSRPDLAEDFSQEVWLRLVERPPVLPEGMPLAPWLYRVARNLFISYLRSRDYDTSRTAELTAIRLERSKAPGPWEELAGNETQRRLQVALAKLPLRYRECLLLAAGADLDSQQAAEVLDLTATAFRKRVSRAREMLAERMGLTIHFKQEEK